MNFIWAILALGIICVVIWFLLRGAITGGADYGEWSRQVRFSDAQLKAMRSLWRWYTTGQEPSSEPLAHLDPVELADLVQKCGLEAVPARYRARGEDKSRRKLLEELQEKGMHEMDAEIIVGMKFGKLGPAREQG